MPRPSANFPPPRVRQALVRFVDSLERYEGTVEELNVAVDGEIGLAWGIHVADFQHKGSPPERTRVGLR